MDNQNTYRGKPIGIDKCYIAKILTDNLEGTTYDEPVHVPGLREVTVTPEFAEAELAADNVMEDSLKIATGAGVKIDNSQLTNTSRALMLGQQYDSKGGLLSKGTDTPPMFAMMFRILLSTQGGKAKYAYICLYKVRFADFEEAFKTKEGTNIQFVTHSGIEGKAFTRASDDAWRYYIREDDPKFDEEQAKEWFTKVPEPAEVISV